MKSKARRAIDNLRHKAANKARASAARRRLFDLLGGPKCVCCGETTPEFLAIDHINNGGAKHRKTTSSLYRYYESMVSDPDLRLKYRVLCHNCNYATYAFGVCPHQKLGVTPVSVVVP